VVGVKAGGGFRFGNNTNSDQGMMGGCGAGAVSKAGAARRQPKAAAAAARCRCPQKRKKMGTGVQPLDVPSDLYPARIKSYYILPSPRLALLHVTVHHSHQRKGTERRCPVASELDETDGGGFVA